MAWKLFVFVLVLALVGEGLANAVRDERFLGLDDLIGQAQGHLANVAGNLPGLGRRKRLLGLLGGGGGGGGGLDLGALLGGVTGTLGGLTKGLGLGDLLGRRKRFINDFDLDADFADALEN